MCFRPETAVRAERSIPIPALAIDAHDNDALASSTFRLMPRPSGRRLWLWPRWSRV